MDNSALKIARSSPRPKVFLNNKSSIEGKDNVEQQQQSNIKTEKWDRFQELKRRREEIESKANKKRRKTNDFIKTPVPSSTKQNPTKIKQKVKTFDITDPSTLPKSIAKYLHMNEHLKDVDHGRLSTKTELEKELDKAVENGDLELASKLSDQIAQNNYEIMVNKAIERKEFNEAKKREEERKANKKKPKLYWGFETKHRWETKSNM
ncbi:protein FAM204A [Rhizophagus clarus]|uniref:Protein FAM204A n=1 Tax=Rhizophagus clarus TaxID=94130 RepID=A0A8H3QJ30_9GLOM|nr:protein FAM204A [Rhizophagus clarus]